jgi:hypothetical protein
MTDPRCRPASPDSGLPAVSEALRTSREPFALTDFRAAVLSARQASWVPA